MKILDDNTFLPFLCRNCFECDHRFRKFDFSCPFLPPCLTFSPNKNLFIVLCTMLRDWIDFRRICIKIVRFRLFYLTWLRRNHLFLARNELFTTKWLYLTVNCYLSFSCRDFSTSRYLCVCVCIPIAYEMKLYMNLIWQRIRLRILDWTMYKKCSNEMFS